jgi:hypothetical protein
MSGEAKELRELARKIEQLVSGSRISSIALPATQALLDYLTMRARLMELESERDDLRVDLKRERAVTDGNRG